LILQVLFFVKYKLAKQGERQNYQWQAMIFMAINFF